MSRDFFPFAAGFFAPPSFFPAAGFAAGFVAFAATAAPRPRYLDLLPDRPGDRLHLLGRRPAFGCTGDATYHRPSRAAPIGPSSAPAAAPPTIPTPDTSDPFAFVVISFDFAIDRPSRV